MIKCVALLSSVMIQDSKGNISFPNSFHPHQLSFKFTQNITTIIQTLIFATIPNLSL